MARQSSQRDLVPEPFLAMTVTASDHLGLLLPTSFLPASTNGRPRTFELDLHGADMALPTSTSACLGTLGDLQPPGTPISYQSAMSYATPALMDWCNAKIKPWDPIQGRGATLFSPDYGQIASVLAYAESRVPSECGTSATGALPSDSGYYSRATQSAFGDSTCGDNEGSVETGSTSSHMAGLQVDRPIVSLKSWMQASLQPPSQPEGVEGSDLMCPTCQKSVKTKSELRKHKQKHEKPHHCDVPGCLRQEGFGTPNDVDRHKKSVHPEHCANSRFYVCTVPDCKAGGRHWPRADNFRQHLKRVHAIVARDDDLDAYVYKPAPPFAPELLGLGSAGDGLQVNASHDSSTTDCKNWPFHDFGAAPDAFQPQSPTDPTTPGPAGQINLNQDANSPHQHIRFMASNETEEPLSRLQNQSCTFQLAGASMLAPQEDSHSQSQEQEAAAYLYETCRHEEALGSDYASDEPTYGGGPEDDTYFFRGGEYATASDNQDDDTEARITMREADRPLAVVSSASATTVNVSNQHMPEEAVSGDSLQEEAPTEAKSATEGSILLEDLSKASALIKALEEQGALADLLEELGYQKSTEQGEKPAVHPKSRVISDLGQVSCDAPNCGKVFPRPCELKKHKKRHEKPYGCTFPNCPKRFGSKNDWKRHENSQHYMLELWICEEPSAVNPNRICEKAHDHREQLKAHLLNDHRVTDPADIERRLDACRFRRDHGSRFWCGFCRTIIEMTVVETPGGGLRAGTDRDRFDHIDDHYSGRIPPRMDISEWKSVGDADLPVEHLTSSETKQAVLGASSQVGSDSLADQGNGRKRQMAAPPRSKYRKRQRVVPETMWLCCHCGNSALTSTTITCVMDNCDNHVKCRNCSVHDVPAEDLVLKNE